MLVKNCCPQKKEAYENVAGNVSEGIDNVFSYIYRLSSTNRPHNDYINTLPYPTLTIQYPCMDYSSTPQRPFSYA